MYEQVCAIVPAREIERWNGIVELCSQISPAALLSMTFARLRPRRGSASLAATSRCRKRGVHGSGSSLAHPVPLPADLDLQIHPGAHPEVVGSRNDGQKRLHLPAHGE